MASKNRKKAKKKITSSRINYIVDPLKDPQDKLDFNWEFLELLF